MDATEHPIFIPSKGRADNCRTADRLVDLGCSNFKIVVEPNDYDGYATHYSTDYLLTLDVNDHGLGYARQWIKAHSAACGDQCHWQIDDDLIFKRWINGKKVTRHDDAIRMLCEVEDVVGRFTNIGIAGLRRQTFAHVMTDPITVNRQPASCVLVNNSTKARYRRGIVEDTDYAMQVLVEGYCTLVFNRLLYDQPSQGIQAGGLTGSVEFDNPMKDQNRELVRQWPGAFQIEYPQDGVRQTRIRPSLVWSKFPQRPVAKAA